jgi:hypothetical protein
VESTLIFSGVGCSFFCPISASLFLSIWFTVPRSPLAHLATICVLGANGLAKDWTWGRREAVHSCERSCCRTGAVEILEVVVMERKMLREAPVRSMVTVVALECWGTGQWRSIDPGRAESEVE